MFWLLACSTRAPAVGGSVILVTLDTTRADALGAYGGPPSPVFDELAAEGVRFEWALAHAPTTLNSHASMFTGLDPHAHGVPRNGFALDESIPTITQRFQAAGWATRAAVAATALDSSMGLDRGFDGYSDDFEIDAGKRFESSASEVVKRALAQVDEADPQKRLFLWTHFYDAHSPYQAPTEVEERVLAGRKAQAKMRRAAENFRQGELNPKKMELLRMLYQAEVAWVDQCLGVLLEGLRERGRLKDAVVVVVADHGEMFFESKVYPLGHGPDVDLPVTRVPLVIWGDGKNELRPSVVDQTVALSDLAPTLLALGGLAPEIGQARNLGPLLKGDALPDRQIFMEATKPERDVGPGWNNLGNEHGVLIGRTLWIENSPEPGLYALAVGQPIIAGDPGPHVRALQEWDAKAPPLRQEVIDAAMREALQALGYMQDE